MELRNFIVTPTHIMLGVQHHKGSASKVIGARSPNLVARIESALKQQARKSAIWRLDPKFQRVLLSAKSLAKRRGDPAVGTGHLLVATLKANPSLAPELKEAIVDSEIFEVNEELAQGKLVLNDRWNVSYLTEPHSFSNFSKFGIGEARMEHGALVRFWHRWSSTTRAQFSAAFNSQCSWHFGPNERKVARFLVHNAEGEVRISASIYLWRLPPREAYPIIVRWLGETECSKINLYQSLQSRSYLPFGSRPLLESELQGYLLSRADWEGVGPDDHDTSLLRAVSCVQALWKLDPGPRYRQLLQEFSRHENKIASGWARAALKDE